MRTLYILRHAKSSWDDAAMSDFERPLNSRGEKAAPFMGRLMRDNGIEPYIILASPAKRARTTAELAKSAGRLSAPLVFNPEIYEASPNTLRKIINSIDDLNPSALLVGHNPGMEGLIDLLTGEHEPMPTAALAVIDLQVKRWKEAGARSGRLVQIYRPRDAMKDDQ